MAFQSAVAHELISNEMFPDAGDIVTRFKALSRMSSFPTQMEIVARYARMVFQSAVAHELISNVKAAVAVAWESGVSKRCRA